jgi:hypothetical protein
MTIWVAQASPIPYRQRHCAATYRITSTWPPLWKQNISQSFDETFSGLEPPGLGVGREQATRAYTGLQQGSPSPPPMLRLPHSVRYAPHSSSPLFSPWCAIQHTWGQGHATKLPPVLGRAHGVGRLSWYFVRMTAARSRSFAGAKFMILTPLGG